MGGSTGAHLQLSELRLKLVEVRLLLGQQAHVDIERALGHRQLFALGLESDGGKESAMQCTATITSDGDNRRTAQ